MPRQVTRRFVRQRGGLWRAPQTNDHSWARNSLTRFAVARDARAERAGESRLHARIFASTAIRAVTEPFSHGWRSQRARRLGGSEEERHMRMHLWGAAFLATVVAAPAFGQTGPGGPGTTGETVTTTTARDTRHDDGFDWGWIGLLGLAGLAPLFMRKDRDRTSTIERR